MLVNAPMLDDAGFDAYIAANDGLVFFHKKLCPNCRVLAKVLDKCRGQLPGLTLAAVDTEEQPALATRLEALRVPTVLLVKNGRVVARKTGVASPTEMIAFCQQG